MSDIPNAAPALALMQIQRSGWSAIQSSPLIRRLASGTFWVLVGTAATRVMSLAASVCVGRLLGATRFGEYGMIQGSVSTFGVFAGFGLGLTATKYVAELRHSDPERAGRIAALTSAVALLTGLLIAGLLLGFAPWLARNTLAGPHLAGSLRVSAVAVFFNAVNGAQLGVLAGLEAFRTSARINLYSGVLALALTVIGATCGGVSGAMWGVAAAAAGTCLISHRALIVQCQIMGLPRRTAAWRLELPVLLHFTLPAVLGGVMVAPAIWLCTAMLVHRPNGYLEMGLFNAANDWRMAVLFLPVMISRVSLPVMSSLYEPKTESRFHSVVWGSVALNSGAAVLMAAVVSVLSSIILRAYGPAYARATWVLIIMAWAAVPASANQAIGQAIASSGRMWFGLATNTGLAACLITASWFGVRWFGAMGLAIAMLIAYLSQCLWQMGWLLMLRRTHSK